MGSQKVRAHNNAQKNYFVLPTSSKKILYAQDKHDVPGGRKLLFSLSNVQ